MNTPTLQDLKKAEQDLTIAIKRRMAEGDHELAQDIKRQQRELRKLIEEKERPLRKIDSPTHLHE
jgi:hypothetical protein